MFSAGIEKQHLAVMGQTGFALSWKWIWSGGIKIDVKLTFIKPLQTEWLSDFYNYTESSDGQEVIQNDCFRSGTAEAIGSVFIHTRLPKERKLYKNLLIAGERASIFQCKVSVTLVKSNYLCQRALNLSILVEKMKKNSGLVLMIIQEQ